MLYLSLCQLWAGNSVNHFLSNEPVRTKKEKPRPPMRKPGEESRKKSVEDVRPYVLLRGCWKFLYLFVMIVCLPCIPFAWFIIFNLDHEMFTIKLKYRSIKISLSLSLSLSPLRFVKILLYFIAI